MIDFHSHILPGVDDGSKSLEESLSMIAMLSDQGVKTVVATPHFYADYESADEFLIRRNKSAEELLAALPEGSPKLLPGAEVRYYPGISRYSELSKLCVFGTKLLLLEMSMEKWTDYTVKELLELSSRGGIRLVIAHMERYMGFQSMNTLYRLYENGVLMQFNASFFLGFSTKRKAISMLRDGEIHFIGSDCHNLSSRAPQIGKAFGIIEKKLGEEFLAEFNNSVNYLINK